MLNTTLPTDTLNRLAAAAGKAEGEALRAYLAAHRTHATVAGIAATAAADITALAQAGHHRAARLYAHHAIAPAYTAMPRPGLVRIWLAPIRHLPIADALYTQARNNEARGLATLAATPSTLGA